MLIKITMSVCHLKHNKFMNNNTGPENNNNLIEYQVNNQQSGINLGRESVSYAQNTMHLNVQPYPTSWVDKRDDSQMLIQWGSIGDSQTQWGASQSVAVQDDSQAQCGASQSVAVQLDSQADVFYSMVGGQRAEIVEVDGLEFVNL